MIKSKTQSTKLKTNSKFKIQNSKQLRTPNYQLRTTRLMTVKVPKKLMRYMFLKGIVILDGIALTLTRVDDRKSEIDVAIIPYTWENTNLHLRRVGDVVNVETDVLGKWIRRLAC